MQTFKSLTLHISCPIIVLKFMMDCVYPSSWICKGMLLLIVISSAVASECQNPFGAPVCQKLLPENYEKYKAPPGKDGPLDIFCRMNIVDIYGISEERMDFELNTYVAFSWFDTRINTNASLTYSPCDKYIWTPDIVYEQAKNIQRFGIGSSYVNISHGGFIQISERITFKVPCVMDFSDYPFDVQHCDFIIGQMSTPDQTAILKWYGDESNPHKNKHNSIEWFKMVEPLQFYLHMPILRKGTSQFYDGDDYTYLIVSFTLVRRLMGSIINIYVPSTLIVAVSCVNFWIRVDAAPARVALSITSLLTLCTQIQQHKAQLPPINYITAVDIWLFVCIVMVFSTLVEYAFAYTSHTQIQVETFRNSNPSPRRSKVNVFFVKSNQGSDKPKTAPPPTREKSFDNSMNPPFIHGNRIDQLCRKIFPTFFVTFAICYGAYYSNFKK